MRRDGATRFSRRALLIAGGAAVVAGRIGDPALASATFEQRFDRLADGAGWGPVWYLRHDRLGFDVRSGLGRLHLPAGLRSTAPAQPIPVLLLDHECRDATQQLRFRVTRAPLRPGLLFRRTSATHFLAVTVEHDRLVLAEYNRANRRILARGQVPRLGRGDHVLQVAVSGRRLTAGLWLAGRAARVQLRAALPPAAAGSAGVLLVPPPAGEPGSLLVSRYRISAVARFRRTRPQAALLITGTPQAGAVSVRAGADIPSSIRFEWSHDQTFTSDVARSPRFAPSAPYTGRTDIAVDDLRPIYWRARLASNLSGTRASSAIQQYRPHRDRVRLVMGAASCAQLWDERACDGFRRFQQAAPARPAILVYQGDLGYAGNSRDSCYRESPDFYAERFVRTLADPYFRALRQTTPVGFTIDDHDYGQVNNASPAEMPPWSAPLWNEFHADPSDLGYFGFRFTDVECVTLDGRRYADPVEAPNTPEKSKLGAVQRDWLLSLLAATDAALVVVFSADIFASRTNIDTFLFGWPDEYRRLMTAFVDTQLRGVRVVILSGDAHGLRIHRHPDPAARPAARGHSIVEFVCSGLAPRSWSAPLADDRTLDPERFVLGRRGLGMIAVDPAGRSPRGIRLRAISGEPDGPTDLFPPLDLPFAPGGDPPSQLRAPPDRPGGLGLHAVE